VTPSIAAPGDTNPGYATAYPGALYNKKYTVKTSETLIGWSTFCYTSVTMPRGNRRLWKGQPWCLWHTV